jgi:peptidoglycan hydrolase CwlO-like protein
MNNKKIQIQTILSILMLQHMQCMSPNHLINTPQTQSNVDCVELIKALAAAENRIAELQEALAEAYNRIEALEGEVRDLREAIGMPGSLGLSESDEELIPPMVESGSWRPLSPARN